MSDPLLERLQRALSPDYRVDREVNRGGWGIVFVAHDVTLNCPVAVKVIRPELATAHAADAFLREARILASVRHPNIVVIHRAGESGGLPYYIMELIEGRTLEDRLASGPLAPAEAFKLGRDLLAGLDAVHHAGIVHRDVKPSNVFVLPQRAVLADFGIARAQAETSPDPSSDGTPGYQAPEQLTGGPVTPRTDLYAVGVVLYEAFTGRRYGPFGEHASWAGVPRRIARVVQRALRPTPAERWPSARAFRHALRGAQRRPLTPTALFAIGGVLTSVAIALVLPRVTWPGAGASLSVAVPPFDYVGPSADRSIADSLRRLVRADLAGHRDFRLESGRRLWPVAGPSLVIRARVTVSDAEVRVQLPDLPLPEAHAPRAAWRTLGDSLTYRVLLAVWDAKSPLAASLPTRALPRTPLGLARFLEAEQLVATAEWERAYRAYRLAEGIDSTCWLCAWRLYEVERWLSRDHDSVRVRRFLAHSDSFPPWYATVMRATQLPLRARLDTLRFVTDRWPEFFLGWVQSGDELLHRGPLVGRRRAEAIPAFATAARRRPDFGPAWEHLAWVTIAEGDSIAATRSLDALDRRPSGHDPYSGALRSLLGLAFAWRFLPDDEAAEATRRAYRMAGASPDLAAGPRMLSAFDAPRGAVVLGRMLGNSADRDLQRSGLIAAALGSVALGAPHRADALVRQLVQVSPELDLAFFGLELEAALAVVDPLQPVADRDVMRRLQAWTSNKSAPELLRHRAVWMSALLARRQPARSAAPALPPPPSPLAQLLAGDSLATAGRPGAALMLTDATDGDLAARRVDPFFRAVLRLRRAEWLARTGDLEGARRELVWHEHTDLVGLPTGLPQAAEIDWAFGTLARWRVARLLDGRTDQDEVCRAYSAVERLWAEGEPPYRARADTARARRRALACSAALPA